MTLDHNIQLTIMNRFNALHDKKQLKLMSNSNIYVVHLRHAWDHVTRELILPALHDQAELRHDVTWEWSPFSPVISHTFKAWYENNLSEYFSKLTRVTLEVQAKEHAIQQRRIKRSVRVPISELISLDEVSFCEDQQLSEVQAPISFFRGEVVVCGEFK